MSNSESGKRKEYSPWEQHEISQMLYFRSLTLRQRMQAVEEMGKVVRLLQQMKIVDRSTDSDDICTNGDNQLQK